MTQSEPSKIYISSSETGYTLAKRLRNQLASEFTSVTLWKDWIDAASSTVIEMLEKAIVEFDFAVIILTRDDMVFQKKRDKGIPQDRDNCFYEAGLFMGSLKRDRCFLVSSIKKSELPVDLQGINFNFFEQPASLTDVTMCGTAMQIPAGRILDKVQEKGAKPKFQPLLILPPSTIFKRESMLSKDQVVVNAEGPVEVAEFSKAIQVQNNIKNDIRYKYFFHADVGGAVNICLLLQYILLANLVKEKDDIDKIGNFSFRCETINNNGDDVLLNLWDISRNGSLIIYFFETAPGFQFCLHSANITAQAKAYVKYKENYIEWSEGQDAKNIFMELDKCCHYKPPHAIFMDTVCLEVRTHQIRKTLDPEFNKHFGDIAEQVKNVCYYGWILSFDGGKGVAEGGKEVRIAKNDTIIGADSGASATVSWIKVTKGSWLEGNAAGKLILNDQRGTFKDENLLVVKKPEIIAKAKANP